MLELFQRPCLRHHPGVLGFQVGVIAIRWVISAVGGSAKFANARFPSHNGQQRTDSAIQRSLPLPLPHPGRLLYGHGLLATKRVKGCEFSL